MDRDEIVTRECISSLVNATDMMLCTHDDMNLAITLQGRVAEAFAPHQQRLCQVVHQSEPFAAHWSF